MTDITEFDNTDFAFIEREGDRRKKDTSVGDKLYVKECGDKTVAARCRRKDDRRAGRGVVDTDGITVWTNDDDDLEFVSRRDNRWG